MSSGLLVNSRLGLQEDLVDPAEPDEVVHVKTAQVGLQRLEHAVHRHAERAGLLAVQLDLHLRRGRIEGGAEAADLRALGGRGRELLDVAGQLRRCCRRSGPATAW